MIYSRELIEGSVAYLDGIGRIIGLQAKDGKMIYGTMSNPYDIRKLDKEEIDELLKIDSIAKYNEAVYFAIASDLFVN